MFTQETNCPSDKNNSATVAVKIFLAWQEIFYIINRADGTYLNLVRTIVYAKLKY